MDAIMKVRSLKTCDTCRKAIKWLKEKGIEATVLDIREIPPTFDEIAGYIDAVGWEKLLNRKSTTWRQLSDNEKLELDENKAARLIASHPTLMKRPVSILEGQIVVGFDPAAREMLETLLR